MFKSAARIVFFILFFIGTSHWICAQKPKQSNPKTLDYGIMYAYNDSLQYETYPQPNGWGYRLYMRYKLLVNQPIIPAIEGNQPFRNEKDARKTARLASSKIANGEMPPTIEVKEIKNLLKLK